MLHDLGLYVLLPLLTTAVVLAFSRLVRGPSLPDRVVSLEVLTTLGMGIITVYAIASDEAVFLDVAIVLALITFLGTVAFARYFERSAR